MWKKCPFLFYVVMIIQAIYLANKRIMPPVRWKGSIVIVMAVFSHVAIQYTDAADGMQQPISMTADGWRPIIGSSRPPPSHYQEEIRYYQNPILKETVKAEPLPTTTPVTTAATTARMEQKTIRTIPVSVNVIHQGHKNGKIPPHTKHGPQYFVLPNHGGHGPHIPLNAVSHGRPGQHGFMKKGQGKVQHGHPNGKRVIKKPIMGQLITSHSTRNEVYVPAPSSGSYSFLSQGKNVRTRESSGLGIVGQKLYSFKQPHAHMEFSSHFPPPSLYQNPPIQHVIFQKQQGNEVIPPYQVDTHQNLLPPPIFKNFADINQVKHNHNGKINPEIRTPNDKIIFGHNPLGPNDLILQLPSYEQSLFGFGKQKVQSPSEVHVTKETLQTFHNDVPQHFNHQSNKEFDQNFHAFRKPITDFPKSPTYEVTEGKWEENTPPPTKFHTPNSSGQSLQLNLPPFLPTPYKADGVVPTSPTQNEVSTIFGQLSNAVKYYPDIYNSNPYFFDVKEVSTHYPILGKPESIKTTTESQEGATGKPIFKPSIEEVQTTTLAAKQPTEKPIRINSNHRRRRPTPRYTTTTQPSTEAYTEKEEGTTPPNETAEVETERPHRPRRPVKTRPTATSTSEEDTYPYRVRDRHRKRPYQNDRKNQYRKRVRPNRYESEEGSNPTESESKEEEVTEVLPIIQHFTTQGFRDIEKELITPGPPPETETKSIDLEDDSHYRRRPSYRDTEEEPNQQRKPTEDNYSEEEDTHYRKTPEIIQNPSTSSYENESRNEEDTTPPNHESLKEFEEDKMEHAVKNYKRVKPHYTSSTTETSSTATDLNFPENEVDFSTIRTSEVISLFEHEAISKVITTTEPSTTMIVTTSTKSHRRRPIKYNASNRPRFSVKDYRQRLNQYSSTSTTSTEAPKATDNVRLRFPTRLRRPLSTTSTTTQATEEATRSKFIPKEPRHSSHPGNEVITENNVKAVNTRLRPFGRTKTTTEHSVTSTPKISIKPNLFSNRRRPPPISLKARIQNRNNNKTANDADNKENEVTTSGTSSGSNDESQFSLKNSDKEENTEDEKDADTTPLADILRNDAVMRVSDLTSSMKNDYEGFKAVPSSSRRVPNYYMISTEDPILPIEAFFSNINDKGK